jgi:hypothetical protein
MLMDFENIFIWLTIYPLAFYLLADSGADFAFKRPQMLFSFLEKSWISYERTIYWLLLGRFLIGSFLIVVNQFWIQILLILVFLVIEYLAGRLYLPKVKR